MKDTEYRPEPLENPDIAQEDIPETPAEAEAQARWSPESRWRGRKPSRRTGRWC